MRRNNHITFIAGFLLGAIMFGSTSAFAAAGIFATASTQRFIANGREVRPEAYLIDGRNYVQLRDLSEIMDFDLTYDGVSNTVYINSGNFETSTPTVTPAPVTKPSTRAAPNGVLEKDFAIWLEGDYQPFDNELEALRLINEEREKVGIKPLTLNLDLCRVARIKAIEMAELSYFSHISPNYGSQADMVKTFGINCQYAGENVAYLGGASAKGVVYNWMNSEGHKANIQNRKFKEAGIGFTLEDGIGYWSLLLIY